MKIGEAIKKGTEAVTREYTTLRKKELKDAARGRRARANLMRGYGRAPSMKDYAYRVMEQAYRKASGNGAYPANARQIMYAARPLVLQMTGGELWGDSNYFTQTLLPDFIEEHFNLTANWDVVFDARGHFTEPHGGESVDLGTLEVRRYIKNWSTELDDSLDITLDRSFRTQGPHCRYKHVLFVEKEGFNELWKRARIAELYDIALMSTKGMSTTAARTLVESLSERGVTIFVLRDFDKSGFSILHTLRTDTRRYTFSSRPNVIDLGLRLADAEEAGLQSEEVSYGRAWVNPREKLKECGATKEECDFLVSSGSPGNWWGERIEINAFDSASLVEWLKAKLESNGVKKLVPTGAALKMAYRRALKLARMQDAIDSIAEEDDSNIEVPKDLAERVRESIEGSALSWDAAVYDLAAKTVEG